ncbi:hypothetical protein ACHAWF_007539 [Thalassiosira exigua]
MEDVGEDTVKVPQLPPAELIIPPPALPAPPSPPPMYVSTYTNPPTRKPTTAAPTTYDPDAYNPRNHIFCGTTWNDATERCSPETFCSGGATHVCESAGNYCWAGVTACNAKDWMPTSEPTPGPTKDETTAPTRLPTGEPTQRPTAVVAPVQNDVSASQETGAGQEVEAVAEQESEVKPEVATTVVRQSYCANSVDELSKCATLRTCNRYKPCPQGQTCYSNVRCSVPAPRPATPPPVPIVSPATDAPTTGSPTTDAPITRVPVTVQPTIQPTIYQLTEEEVAQRLTNMNSYCASSFAEVLDFCAVTLRTCNAGELVLCPAGTYCFENIVCPDSEAVTRAPVTRAPVTREPTARPTMRPQTVSPTAKPNLIATTNYDVENGDTEALATQEAGPPPQNYCGATGAHMHETCATTAPTCNNGDPCPLGMFCFGDHVCDMGAASIAADGTTPQKFCAESEEVLATTCGVAPTCNRNDLPCPLGLFCFGNYACAARSPTPGPSVNADAFTLLNDPNFNTANMAEQNYCATSAEELKEVCVRGAPTCNTGDMPCPKNTVCFSNVVCESELVAGGPGEESSVPLLEEVEQEVATSMLDPTCQGLCLQPIDHYGCDFALSVMQHATIMPCANFPSPPAVGDLCAADGRCGTDTGLDNCPGGQDVYVRLNSVRCTEHGLVGGSGVITLSGINVGGTVQGGEASVSQDVPTDAAWPETNDEAVMQMSAQPSPRATLPPINEFPYEDTQQWEDWAPSDDDDGDKFADNHDLAGWWLMIENGAASSHIDGRNALVIIALAPALMALYLLK